MYTQCPECSSVFEISPEHLGAASGMVQCGVCNTTFNALRRLTQQPPETAIPEPDGTGASLDSKGDTATGVESEPNAQTGLFDDDPPSDDQPADSNETPESHTIDDEVTIAPDEFSGGDTTQADENTTAGELTATDQNAADLHQADAEQTNNRDEPELDASPEEAEATEEANADDEAMRGESPGDSNLEHSAHSDKEDLAEAVSNDAITDEDENDTSEIDESDVDAAEEELHELLEDLDEDDDVIIVNPDDLFSTSQVLDEWDIEEGEHDLEAILADETLNDENESDEVPETLENARDNTESDSNNETWEDQQDNDESDASEPEELEDSDQLEDLQDLDELGEFDEEDIDDEDLIDTDQNDDDNEVDDSDDKNPDVDDDDDHDDDHDDDDVDVDDTRNDDEDFIDENQDAEAHDIDEQERQDKVQNTEVEESDDKTQQAESDEADTSSDSDEDIDVVASDNETGAEDEKPGETEPDSSAVLTEGVNGQFDDDYDDADDLKDLGHYLSPKKSLIRRLGEGSIVVVLAGLLLGQYVHHNRTELATHPKFGTHVRNAYSALGKDLRANWKVSDYRVARHTIVPGDDDADLLMARATVVNNSGFERPLPLVRLQLKNRWGDPIYGRVFTPDEYLEGTAPDTLAGNGKLEVSLDLVHPAPNEEIGYSFDVCLDTPAGPDCGTPQVFTK